MVKEGNKRIMITLDPQSLKALEVVMKELHTKQPSKAIQHVLSWVLPK